MKMIRIGRTSFVSLALTLALGVTNARAQGIVPALPPVPPLPPDFPAFAIQGPGPVPTPKVYTDGARVAAKGTNDLYDQARNAIEQEQYGKALGQLDALIARFDTKSLAESIANRIDAAMYWKAYALGKQRELSEALKTLDVMRSRFADSRWLKDAMALKVEMLQASGQAVSPDSQTDEDLKLLALRGLMQSDPDRAVAMIEQLLSGSSSIKVKENALFVLSQSRLARALEILGNAAKGGNPDVQMRAIRYLGVMNQPGNDQILQDAYRSSSDETVKRAIIRSFMVSGNRARLAAIAGDANSSPALRGEAVQQLGVMHAGDELARLYARESAPEVKKRIIQGLFVSQDAARLVELAKAEKDLELKKTIVQKLSLMKSKEATDYLVELLK
jgi:tetratricopeptide (TPR) repeat protein